MVTKVEKTCRLCGHSSEEIPTTNGSLQFITKFPDKTIRLNCIFRKETDVEVDLCPKCIILVFQKCIEKMKDPSFPAATTSFQWQK